MRTVLSIVFFAAACGPSDSPGDPDPVDLCTDDSDCTSGFCGWDADNDRICKPYGDIGDQCGGFVVPDARNFCDPSLVCYQDPAQNTDFPGVCVETCRNEFADGECTEGFCAPTDNQGTLCKPYAGENESCGGFTSPEWLRVCDPSMRCSRNNRQSPFIADAPGFCAADCTDNSDCASDQYCQLAGGETHCQYYTPAGVGCDFAGVERECEAGTSCLPDSNGFPGYGTCN